MEAERVRVATVCSDCGAPALMCQSCGEPGEVALSPGEHSRLVHAALEKMVEEFAADPMDADFLAMVKTMSGNDAAQAAHFRATLWLGGKLSALSAPDTMKGDSDG